MIDSQLSKHRDHMASFDMRAAFASEPNRAKQFSLTACGLLLDYSKNLIKEETMKLLYQLARERQVIAQLERQFDGAKVNRSEDRAALHTALRGRQKRSAAADAVMEQAKVTRWRIYDLRRQLVKGALTGFTNQPIDRIVNIGIGGSHLGPLTVCTALAAAADAPDCGFLSSLSPDAAEAHRHRLATTLFVISSKSFTTQETLMNAKRLLAWYEKETSREQAAKHFYAVTAAPAKARNFGIPDQQIFPLDESIGGRFSLWSAIALPIIMHIGEAPFEELLKGAYDMDQHSLTSEAERNMPLQLALLAYWYARYWQTQTHCINVYEHALSRLPEYCQQLFMESNGKKDGSNEILWGGVGSEIQHSYMQLCHQGKHLIPLDIICAIRPPQAKSRSAAEKEAHRVLQANALAQAQALLKGRSAEEAQAEIADKGLAAARSEDLVMPGNRPSNFLLYEELIPYSLGAILSLYEHRTALLGYLADSNPFDQWGVELGKQLGQQIYAHMTGSQVGQFDSSTNQLIERMMKS